MTTAAKLRDLYDQFLDASRDNDAEQVALFALDLAAGRCTEAEALEALAVSQSLSVRSPPYEAASQRRQCALTPERCAADGHGV